MERDGWDLSARLLAYPVGEKTPLVIPLPITLKGAILELVYLPEVIERLVLEPLGAPGEARLLSARITRVSAWRRHYRMLRRVVATVKREPWRRLRQGGLTPRRMLTDLAGAYGLAGRFRAIAPYRDYGGWVREFDTLTERDRRRIRRRGRRMAIRGEVVIPVTAASEPEALAASLVSLTDQLMPPQGVRLLVAPGDQQAGRLAEQALRRTELTGTIASDPASGAVDWCLWLPAGTVLAEHALYWWLHEASRHPEASLIYSDHDHLSPQGERHAPVFKPQASPELLRATAYLGEAWLVRGEALAALGVGELLTASSHRLQLRLVEGLEADQWRHLPAVLWHKPVPVRDDSPWPRVSAGDALAVAGHLARQGVKGEVVDSPRGHCRVRYALPESAPAVSIIVPTRDGLHLLAPCIESVLNKSRYDDFEVLIMDNQSAEPETLAWFDAIAEDPRVRVIRHDAPFNFSAINNAAAREARGQVLCLLNNDTEVIGEAWLEELVGRLMQPGVGVVGAKLYYGDGRVQHAGDAVGPGGLADHFHSRLPGEAPGYGDRAILAQELSAVTAACLVTRRELFEALGGLDEANLAVAFNDVDYCLRVREAGWQVQWTPYAELYHLESVSRGKDDSPEKQARAAAEAAYMRRRWAKVLEHDPFYNPNLNYRRPDFTLGHAPRVDRPW